MKPEFKNLKELLGYRAKERPDKTFIIFGRRKVSFKELQGKALSLASFLSKSGVSRGDKVCIWMYNCPEFVSAYFGVMFLGAIAVPINNMFKREEAKYIVEDSKCKMIICSPEKIEDCLNIHLRAAFLDVITSFSFNPSLYSKVSDLGRIFREYPPFDRDIDIEPDDTAEILYTSGTTGKPKGACLSHRNLLANVKDCAIVIKARSKDVFICFLPLFHSFASTVCMIFPLYLGATTVIFRAIRPFKRIIRSVLRNKVSVFVGVPSIYALLKDIKLPWILKTPLIKLINPVRVCISGAAALPKEILPIFERRLRVPLLEGYGLTETSPVATLNPLMGRRKPGSIGLPLPSVKVKVVDKQGREVDRGVIGELLIKGPNVMKGYFNLDAQTREAIDKGFLHTGDLAKVDEEDYLYIEGRIKDMINVRGLNVYPKEIEEVLYQLPYVTETAVVGVNHPKKGEVPVGFVVLKQGSSAQSKDILVFLRGRLAAFKVPLRIEFRQDLPKNATGKILKYVLRGQVETGFFSSKTDPVSDSGQSS